MLQTGSSLCNAALLPPNQLGWGTRQCQPPPPCPEGSYKRGSRTRHLSICFSTSLSFRLCLLAVNELGHRKGGLGHFGHANAMGDLGNLGSCGVFSLPSVHFLPLLHLLPAFPPLPLLFPYYSNTSSILHQVPANKMDANACFLQACCHLRRVPPHKQIHVSQSHPQQLHALCTDRNKTCLNVFIAPLQPRLISEAVPAHRSTVWESPFLAWLFHSRHWVSACTTSPSSEMFV